MKLTCRLFTGLVASVVVLLASLAFAAILPYFFQGFESDTSGWFPWVHSSLKRVLEPSSSTSYNSGTTSAYANGINAADGAYFARVGSAVATTDGCTIDPSGPGSNDSLLCYGPYTDFNLPTGTTASPLPFPADGYTTQVDIYLDVAYATQHPDCGTASPVGAPCLPNTPGAVNPACTSNPSTTDCEGSRFTWTLGVNQPDGSFLQDYVFQVGTAPDPSGNFGGCTAGYIINAQYNSFRSGGIPYSGFEPKCITQSGWYTFQQIFKNVGGFLEVDFNILDPTTGNVVNTCKDTNGATVACSWVRLPNLPLSPVRVPIEQVGCPAYGWFANEEINDLPFDNTRFFGDCFGKNVGQITPTDTTCQAYADGTAATLSQLAYTVKGQKINSVSPGVFFYYTRVSGSAGDTVNILQSHTGSAPGIAILNSQAVLYTTTCSKLDWGTLTVNPDGTVTGTLPATGSFIVGVKYNPSSLKGKPVPVPSTSTYSFGTGSHNTVTNIATIDLVKK